MRTSLATFRKKLGAKGLAWLAFGCAFVGGVTATASWLGATVAAVVGAFWWWVPLVLIVVVGMLVMFDLVIDGIPNRTAIYGVMAWPSLVLSVEGKLGRNLRGWIGEINSSLDRTIAAWITDAPRGSAAVLTAIAVMAVSAAVVYAEKYAKRATTRSTPATTAASPAELPRRPRTPAGS